MFKERTCMRGPKYPTFEFDDKDGDTCCLQFYESEDGNCHLIELQIYGEHGCMVLTKEQAIEFANKIIEQVEQAA
ncbi:hypothetical protein [Citrobacter sedlakii]|uniref:hypothetical protein n=1 Tax=Citrobacter sedlakii TaxID=67826 RepID=UPI00388D1FEF